MSPGLVRLQAPQKHRGLTGLGSGSEDGALVGLQHLQPVRKVLRMISARLKRNPQLGAQERSAKLADQFFHRLGFSPETPGQVPVTAVNRPGPVGELMEQGGVVSLGGG